MPLTETKKEAERRMNTSLEAFRTELKHLRTGRASVALLDGILVEYYGTPTPLIQVATLAAPDATLLVAQPYEPGLCPLIEKAIRKSDLGLNPSSDGRVVRIPVPPPTEERRKEIARKAHALAEQARIEIRHHRHDANEKVRKDAKANAVSSDDEKRALEEVQKLTDRAISEVDTVLKAKETEILTR